MSNPPPGGREVKPNFEQERRDYYAAIDSADYKAAMKHISEISDALLPVWYRKLGLTSRVG